MVLFNQLCLFPSLFSSSVPLTLNNKSPIFLLLASLPLSCTSSHLTTEGLLELLGELLDDTVALHVVHVVIQRITGHLPQGAHVHTSHTDGKNLNTSIPCTLSHILYIVLGTPVCDNYGNL